MLQFQMRIWRGFRRALPWSTGPGHVVMLCGVARRRVKGDARWGEGDKKKSEKCDRGAWHAN